MTRLVDVDRVLALFAEGVAGRPYHVKSVAELPMATADEPVDAAHDGRSLYLPDTVESFEDDVRNAGVYRVLALERLAFREFGTYRFDMNVARSRVSALAGWPASASDEAGLAVFFAGFPKPSIARRVFRAIETARVRLAAEARYPGSRRYRRRGAATDLAKALADLATEPVNLAPLVADALVADALAPGADVYASAAATAACCETLALTALADDAEPGPGLELLQREARLEDWDEELAKLDSRIAVLEFAAEAGEVEAATGEAADGQNRETNAELATLVAERDRKERRLAMERATVRRSLGDEHFGARSFRYDEWDYANGVYLRSWCRVFEERAQSASGEALLRAVRPHAKAVRRRFEQVRPAGYQRVKKTLDGDELDLDAIVDARVDIRAGVSPDERVHSRRERLRRDVAAALLVDLSASTDDIVEKDAVPRKDGAAQNLRDPYFDDPNYDYAARMAEDAAKRRVIDIEREAVLLMAEALEGLGDRFAVYGFSGYGRNCVEFTVAKEFDDPMNHGVVDGIAAMKPKRSTRMGPATRHACAKLAASGAALKVLLIISDGYPQDHDYGPNRSEREYGVQDTAKALREAEAQGVETFCVTVDRSGHDYLRRMCPTDRYMVIEETGDLAEALQVAYRRLTRI